MTTALNPWLVNPMAARLDLLCAGSGVDRFDLGRRLSQDNRVFLDPALVEDMTIAWGQVLRGKSWPTEIQSQQEAISDRVAFTLLVADVQRQGRQALEEEARALHGNLFAILPEASRRELQRIKSLNSNQRWVDAIRFLQSDAIPPRKLESKLLGDLRSKGDGIDLASFRKPKSYHGTLGLFRLCRDLSLLLGEVVDSQSVRKKLFREAAATTKLPSLEIPWQKFWTLGRMDWSRYQGAEGFERFCRFHAGGKESWAHDLAATLLTDKKRKSLNWLEIPADESERRRGKEMLKQGRYREAESHFRELSARTGNWRYSHHLGQALAGLKRYEEAGRAFAMAAKDAPSQHSDMLLFDWGLLLAQTGKLQAAADLLGLALLCGETVHPRALCQFGVMLRKVGEIEASLNCLFWSVSLFRHPIHLCELGITLREVGKVGESETVLREAVGQGRNPRDLCELGITLKHAKQSEKTLAVFEEAYEESRALGLFHPRTDYWYARALRKAGRIQKAAEILKQCTTLLRIHDIELPLFAPNILKFWSSEVSSNPLSVSLSGPSRRDDCLERSKVGRRPFCATKPPKKQMGRLRGSAWIRFKSISPSSGE